MRIDDLKKLLAELEKLDQVVFRMDDLKKEFEEKIQQRITRQAAVVSAILAGLFALWYFLEIPKVFRYSMVGITELESFLQMFGLSFLAIGLGISLSRIFENLWSNNRIPGGQRFVAKRLGKAYAKRQRAIAIEVQKVASSESAMKLDIPKKYLNTSSISYVVSIVESGAVQNMDEAFELLELEANDPKVRRVLIPNENAMERAEKAVYGDLLELDDLDNFSPRTDFLKQK